MKQVLTFIHPTLFNRREVRVGPDHLLVLAGLAVIGLKSFEWLSGEHIAGWPWYAGAAVLAHARLWRLALTPPVLGSIVVALMSWGMSMLVSGLVVNRLVAQHYRASGWKIRNVDGELGEYSSRFLAVDQLGFRESDLMDSVVRTHLNVSLIGDDEVVEVQPTAMPGRSSAARPSSRRRTTGLVNS